MHHSVNGYGLLTTDYGLNKRIFSAHPMPMILEHLVDLARADLRNLPGDAVMQAVLGRRW